MGSKKWWAGGKHQGNVQNESDQQRIDSLAHGQSKNVMKTLELDCANGKRCKRVGNKCCGGN
jgi:hypothetical protein